MKRRTIFSNNFVCAIVRFVITSTHQLLISKLYSYFATTDKTFWTRRLRLYSIGLRLTITATVSGGGDFTGLFGGGGGGGMRSGAGGVLRQQILADLVVSDRVQW